MKTASEISAEIAEMQRQVRSLKKAAEQLKYNLVEADLYKATGLKVGDKCILNGKIWHSVSIADSDCSISPFVVVSDGAGWVQRVIDFSKLQKITI